MISNYEFIKAQSFEVAWAIFRCTELFTQSDLRKKVESAAVDLIADYDMIGNDMENEFPRIEKLVSLLRLAESVKQITSVNANVLYRELDNLTKATRLEIIERRDKKNIAVSLENIFTNSAYVDNLQPTTYDQQQNSNSEDLISVPVIPTGTGIQSPAVAASNSEVVNPAIDKSEVQQFGNIESLISAAVQSSQPITEPVTPVLRSFGELRASQAQDETPAAIQSAPNSVAPSISDLLRAYSTPTPASAAQNSIETQVRQSQPTPVVARPIANTPSTGSWQHVILQKVKELNQTTTKELTTSFPEISERTVRFYLQKLVDNGQIDRIGSTGPGAAYRAK